MGDSSLQTVRIALTFLYWVHFCSGASAAVEWASGPEWAAQCMQKADICQNQLDNSFRHPRAGLCPPSHAALASHSTDNTLHSSPGFSSRVSSSRCCWTPAGARQSLPYSPTARRLVCWAGGGKRGGGEAGEG